MFFFEYHGTPVAVEQRPGYRQAFPFLPRTSSSLGTILIHRCVQGSVHTDLSLYVNPLGATLKKLPI